MSAIDLKLAKYALEVSIGRESDVVYPSPAADAMYGSDMRAGLAALQALIDAAPALPAGLPDAPCESCARKDAVYDAAFKEFARFIDEKEVEVASLRRAALPAGLPDVGDYALVQAWIWASKAGSDKTTSFDVDLARAKRFLAALEGSATLPSDTKPHEPHTQQDDGWEHK